MKEKDKIIEKTDDQHILVTTIWEEKHEIEKAQLEAQKETKLKEIADIDELLSNFE